jgi:hypothetical protein
VYVRLYLLSFSYFFKVPGSISLVIIKTIKKAKRPKIEGDLQTLFTSYLPCLLVFFRLFLAFWPFFGLSIFLLFLYL